jgi:ComF family protein
VFVSRQGADHLCGACIEKPRKFHRARAAGIYEKGLLKAVHCLKYKGRIELARPLGRVLFSSFQQHWQSDEIDILLPVPLHRRRMRSRGFNQSLLLLRDWPRLMTAAGGDAVGIQIAPRLLARSKATPPQIGLGRKERRKNLRGAFTVTTPDQVKKKRILLVDDVYTTGATADACATALRRAGAARVEVLTLARTLSR